MLRTQQPTATGEATPLLNAVTVTIPGQTTGLLVQGRITPAEVAHAINNTQAGAGAHVGADGNVIVQNPSLTAGQVAARLFCALPICVASIITCLPPSKLWNECFGK